jgi:DNA-binding response OmpR family regulator
MKKILVVEDDRKIAAALAVRLKAAGYEVLTAFDGREGLLAAVGQKPDLIVSDIWMPEPIGFLNQERLHQLGLEGMPVIYITASRKEDLRQIARQEGAAAFFEKPYQAEELLGAIARALSEISLAV